MVPHGAHMVRMSGAHMVPHGAQHMGRTWCPCQVHTWCHMVPMSGAATCRLPGPMQVLLLAEVSNLVLLLHTALSSLTFDSIDFFLNCMLPRILT